MNSRMHTQQDWVGQPAPLGYTHRISWVEYNKILGMYVEKSFRTTSDAIIKHWEILSKRESVKNLSMVTI